MSKRTFALLTALAAAPLAVAQPAPPPLTEAPAAPPTAQAPAAAQTPPAATPAPATPPSDLSDLLRTRVEQVKRGNRVSEVRVTGPGGEVRYTMDVGDARPPEPWQPSATGLSTPNFFRLEF